MTWKRARFGWVTRTAQAGSFPYHWGPGVEMRKSFLLWLLARPGERAS